MSERGHHLSEEHLARYQDGDLPAREARHLEACPECGSRLRDLEAANTAYREYLNSTPVGAPPRAWRTLDGMIAEHESRQQHQAWRWRLAPVLGAAVCLGVVLSAILLRPRPERVLPASELLTRSAQRELASQSMVSMRVRGRSLVRPAVLTEDAAELNPELAHLAMLFDVARYSWRDPLSARSFEAWRNGLRQKQDSVTVIHGGAETAYRVRTDTNGVLRSAALTLRAKDLHATEGTFQFEGEESFEMEETATAALPRIPAPTPSPRQSVPTPAALETPASPADTLHVLAALNAIGADVGEPIEISQDAHQQVLVRAAGLAPERARQIETVLGPLPHVKLTFDSTGSNGPSAPAQDRTPERSSTGMPSALRQRFEERLGGAVAFQELTDRVLEASGLAFARAHALELLASRFPPQTEMGLGEADRVLLDRLRQGHIAALDDLTTRMAKDLEAILPPVPFPEPERVSAPSRAGGRGSERDRVATAQQLDESLNRLLAGSYSESSGQALLSGLADQLANLRRLIELRKESGR